MLMPLIEDYLVVRRAAGFQLGVTECLLRDYARAATAAGDTHVHTLTAIGWAAQAPSVFSIGGDEML